MDSVAAFFALAAGLMAMVVSPATVPPGDGSKTSAGPLALIAGGGSGGHVFPGLAVAEELVENGWRVAMVGAEGGLEARLAAERGFGFHALAARPVLGRGLAQKASAALVLARSTLGAVQLIRRFGPRLVIGTGGYLSAPAALGAALCRRPLVLLEPNAEAGMANRWLSRLAKGAATAHKETASSLHCPTWTTGVPVRSIFFEQPAAGQSEETTRILVLGGSQGALKLNQALPAVLIEGLGSRSGSILHQTGAAHLDRTVDRYRRLLPRHRRVSSGDSVILEPAGSAQAVGGPGPETTVEVTPFLEDMASAMGASRLIVSRAGAVTLAEICAAGRASILIPLPIAAGHQESNARALERAGAALLVEQSEMETLSPALCRLLADGTALSSMAESARSLANPSAARDIADHAIALAGATGR